MKFNLLSQDFLQNPYPVYAWLRENDPVHYHVDSQSSGMWLITRYKDVEACLTDSRLSSGGRRGSHTLNALDPETLKANKDFLEFYNKWLLFADPPDHTRLRKLANKGFTRGHVERLRPYMKGLAEGLLENLPKNQPLDFMQEFAVIMPAMVIVEMLGVPQKDRDWLVEMSNEVAALIGLMKVDPAIFQKIRDSYLAMTDYFMNHIDQLRKRPQDNVLSSLIQATDEEDRLTADELYAQAVILLIGGHETTRNLIGSGLHLLLKHPLQMAKLRTRPELMASAVEEILRFESPIQFIGRTAAEDIQLHGKTIKKGQVVMLMLASAHRDTTVYKDPDIFNIERSSNKHLAFGAGRHLCLGAPLARVQGQVVFEAIFNRYERISLMKKDPVWVSSPVFRGITSLHIRLDSHCEGA